MRDPACSMTASADRVFPSASARCASFVATCASCSPSTRSLACVSARAFSTASFTLTEEYGDDRARLRSSVSPSLPILPAAMVCIGAGAVSGAGGRMRR